MSDKGLRYNEGKLKWSFVDFDSFSPMVKVLEKGYVKYGNFNWKKGLKNTEVCESLLRHLIAYLSGENTDKESGESHIGHIQANAMFLGYNLNYKKDMDDRFIDINKTIL